MKRKPVYEEMDDPVAGYDEVRYQKAREKRRLLEQQSKAIITPDSPAKSLWNASPPPPVNNSVISVDKVVIQPLFSSPNIAGDTKAVSRAILTPDIKLASDATIQPATNNESDANNDSEPIITARANIAGVSNIEPPLITTSAAIPTRDVIVTPDAIIAANATNAGHVVLTPQPNIAPHAIIAGVHESRQADTPHSSHAEDQQDDKTEPSLHHLFSTPHANIAGHVNVAWEPNIVSQLNIASAVNSVSHANIPPDTKIGGHAKKQRSANIPRQLKIAPHAISSEEPAPSRIMQNYSRRDREVTNLMQLLTPNEWKVYCYFLSVTHESWVPEMRAGVTHCWTTHPTIQRRTGIASNNTVGKTVESLEARGLVRRTYTARRSLEKSQYRVYLPCELTGYQGTTKLVYEKGDDR
jgi:hypothetical protein